MGFPAGLTSWIWYQSSNSLV